MSKGSGDRVTDKKRFDENFGKIDWHVLQQKKWVLGKWRASEELRCRETLEESPPEGKDGRKPS